jgi:hypothetical protein
MGMTAYRRRRGGYCARYVTRVPRPCHRVRRAVRSERNARRWLRANANGRPRRQSLSSTETKIVEGKKPFLKAGGEIERCALPHRPLHAGLLKVMHPVGTGWGAVIGGR